VKQDLPFNPTPVPPGKRPGFAEDFRRFFTRGLATIMPTLITIWLLVWVWNFLLDNVGVYIIFLIRTIWYQTGQLHWVTEQPVTYINTTLSFDFVSVRILGVTLAVLLIYIIGVFVGNLLGKTAWRIGENAAMKIPLVRAIYPAVKQVTDFVLASRSQPFAGSRVVAVQPHTDGIWSIGMITGRGYFKLDAGGAEEMAMVFIPSSPTSISGYVLVVPRQRVVELPISVEEAMRLLVTAGVVVPQALQGLTRNPSDGAAAKTAAK